MTIERSPQSPKGRPSRTSSRFVTLLGMGAILGSVSLVVAETTDFGGWSERFKGKGDRVPPRCQIDIPATTTEPFFVKWNCSDNFADPSEIRTELWLYRNGASAGELVANFLGFPASVQVDAALLRADTVAAGLPAGFKLLARDRAGIGTISPLLVVRAQDNALSNCSLTIQTESTDSSDSTTGTPARTVQIDDAAVNVTQSSTTQLSLSTRSTNLADPCEINTVCFDETRVSFSSALTLGTGDNDGKAEGTVSIIPGSLVVNVSGTATVDGTLLKQVDVSGTTKIDDQDATVTLSCDR